MLEPIPRKRYFLVGLVLMLLKYAGETAWHFYHTGAALHPLIFLFPSLNLRRMSLGDLSRPQYSVDQSYYLGLILWTLPFLWVGLDYSVRRARDAGISPWFGLGFLIPFWNFVVMGMLSTLPTSVLSKNAEPLTEQNTQSCHGLRTLPDSTRKILQALLYSVLLFVPVSAIAILLPPGYGSVLFISLPTVVAAIASYIWNRPQLQSKWSSFFIAFSTLIFLGIGMLLFAVEGFVCVLMAIPFVLVGGLLGAMVGRQIAAIRPQSEVRSDVLWVSLPLLFAALGDAMAPEQGERLVSSEVRVEAPIEVVWQNVVAFPRIPDPQFSSGADMLFALGIAYPTQARIEGEGVGAIRYCSFSTGDFVEPITVWNAPKHLAFDVREQPIPLRETSFWGEIHPPHLYHSFRSSRGEFLLLPQSDGSTLLRGNTYYRLAMGPTAYWAMLSDSIVHSIHLRVLKHIQRISEVPQKNLSAQ